MSTSSSGLDALSVQYQVYILFCSPNQELMGYAALLNPVRCHSHTTRCLNVRWTCHFSTYKTAKTSGQIFIILSKESWSQQNATRFLIEKLIEKYQVWSYNFPYFARNLCSSSHTSPRKVHIRCVNSVSEMMCIVNQKQHFQP